MAKLQIEDLVYVRAPLPGVSGGGSGIIKAISSDEDGTQYLVEFDGGVKEWYHRNLVRLLQGDLEVKPTKAPRQTGWSQNPTLRESILDAWYELSPKTFSEAYEAFEGFGAAMLNWLKDTNPELYRNCYLKGHNLMGIKISYVKEESST